MSQHYNKEIYVKDYFEIHNHYVKLFGKSTLILMQVGSFHECYNTDTDGPNLYIIGEKINMTVTQKNKNKPLSISNPRMMGFPSYIVEEMIDRIVELGYTVVRIDQTTEPPNPKREIVGVFSQSTTLSNTTSKYSNKNSNLVCIVFDGIKLKTPNPILCIGVSAYNMMTGIGCVYETISTTYDTMIALDNVIRFLEKYPPSETIYHFSGNLLDYIKKNGNINRMTTDEILKYINIRDDMTTYKITNEEMIINVKYQQQVLNNIYKNNLESINIHMYNYARFSLIGLLEFTKNHQPILLTKLKEPSYFENNNTLYIGNRGLEQLNIIPTTEGKSLFDIICKTKTPMGKRYLMDMLCNPLISSDIMTERYNIIEVLMTKINNINLCETIYKSLTNICDMPKVLRKMEINKINPNELISLYRTLVSIMSVIKIIRTIGNDNVRKTMKQYLGIDKDMNENIKEIINYIDNTFDVDYIENLSYANYKEESYNYIKNDNYKNILSLSKKIETSNNFMDMLVTTLEGYIEEMNSKVIKKDMNAITLKFNDKDGHYMFLTKRRCKILKDKLATINEIDVGGIKIKVKDLEFTDLPKSNNTKITCKDILKISTDVVLLKAELATEMKNAFNTEMIIFLEKYQEILSTTINMITMLDYMNSGALCAVEYGYCKPIIKETDNSYFDATELRHPIVELINTDTYYHPHNVSLGKDNMNCGILLYGLNASGKSTLIKSIGMAIIMAQIGYFVPAKKYIFSPFMNLFTRIIGNDNIYKGMSSFMVEMIELMAILKRNNNKTLVIGDELCRGTEEKSANIIVTYMLETLDKNNCCFITATHLHAISELATVNNLKKVKIMHLKVTFDEEKDIIIYDRELSEGQGDKYYGVMVAKYLMRNDDFNNRTKELELEYDDYKIKKSNYNKDIYMFECAVCKSKKNLETHHILPQKDCDDYKGKDKPHIKKNSIANLVILCSKCHDKHDRGDINIIGWMETSNGRVLQYS